MIKLTEKEKQDLRGGAENGYAGLEVAVEQIIANRYVEIADEWIAELICCHVYDDLSGKDMADWTAEDRKRYRSHDICYWTGACVHDLLERAGIEWVKPTPEILELLSKAAGSGTVRRERPRRG